MVSFLFWNLRRRSLELVLRRLTTRNRLDVLILAECMIPEHTLLKALNAANQGPFRRIPALASRGLDLYTRFDDSCFGPVLKESDHYLIRTLTPSGGVEVVLAMAHLASPRFKDRRARHSRLIGFANDIRAVEKSHKRTVLVGDLNLNPFDDALLDVRGLNALSDRRTVQRKVIRRFGTSTVEEFPLFYNPMWNHFGDVIPPAGTYYYDQSNPEVDPLWNIFDQVLLRATLLDRFQNKGLKILTTDGTVSFVREDGRPNGDVYSDHLPRVFNSICAGGLAMPVADFWPDFQVPESIDSPVFLLKEQAAKLRQKTKGLVLAGLRPASTPDGSFWIGFDLYSPALGEYSYRLFEVMYPTEFFPLTLTEGEKAHTAQNLEQFNVLLSSVLRSPRTKQVVEAIMAQATALAPVGAES
jgi:hypothetical protein